MTLARRPYPSPRRASTSRWLPSGSGTPFCRSERPRLSSAPKTVFSPTSRAASATRATGSLAPSRKLYDEWQCSSAQAGPSAAGDVAPGGSGSGPSTGGLRGSRMTRAPSPDSGSPSSSSAPSFEACPSALFEPQDRRRSNSFQGIGGLFQPMIVPAAQNGGTSSSGAAGSPADPIGSDAVGPARSSSVGPTGSGSTM